MLSDPAITATRQTLCFDTNWHLIPERQDKKGRGGPWTRDEVLMELVQLARHGLTVCS
jgi:hypothetical protein